MKSITIHGLEDPLDSLIREKARREGLSLNKTIKKMLEEALGIESKSQIDRKGDFLDLFGLWTEEEGDTFLKAIEDFNTVDPEDWM